MQRRIREKQHRLPKEMYVGFRIVAFTANIKNRELFFISKERFEQCEEILLDALKQFECEAEIYLFMPDHVHCVLRGESETADVLSAMKLFKQRSGYWLSKYHTTVHWQKDYYDHIIRKEDEISNHIKYILNNPVRAGLTNDWKNYQFKGSTKYNLDEWIQ